MKTNTHQIAKLIREHDKKRDQLARKNKLNDLLKTYDKEFDIENFNSPRHWNDIFKSSGNLATQSPMTKDKIDKIVREIPLKKISILDLGIGDGFVEEKLKRRKIKYKLFGIDISKVSIEKAIRNFTGEFILADVFKIDRLYRGQKFDLIIAIELLEHISVSKLFTLYRNIYNLLENDGKFILSIPINERLHLMDANPSAHVRDYTYEIVKAELKLNGFKIEKAQILFAFNKYYKIKKLLSQIFRKRWKPNSLIIVAKKIKEMPN